MTFRDWQDLTPEKAAREVIARVHALSKPQQRAAIAVLASKEDLVTRFRSAPRGTPLGGVPFFAKDIFDFAGTPTLAGSTFLDTVRPSPRPDGAFARVLHAAGAVFVGKTHLHEFAYGITGENPHYGDVEHPRFAGRTTGGSSSGSAAVVAADVVPLALASDTGGSVRVPASFCGLYGFRLTPRHPWIADAFPLSSTFDTAGWFTSRASDMQATLGTLVDLRRSREKPRGGYLELGALEPDVASACRQAAAGLTKALPADVGSELLRGFEPSLEAYHAIVASEAWEVHKPWAEKNQIEYDPVVWSRLIRVQKVTRAQQEAARRDLEQVRAVWAKYFLTNDFLVMPATPMAALTKRECNLENRSRVLTLTTPASLGGLPALTVPVSLASGLTTGLQIVTNDAGSPVFNWALDHFASVGGKSAA